MHKPFRFCTSLFIHGAQFICAALFICTALFACAALTGCGAAPDSTDQAQPDSTAVSNPSSEKSSAESPEGNGAESDPGSANNLPESAYIYTTKDNLISMSESALVDGIDCQILGCEVTSVFGDRNPENLDYFYEEEGIDDSHNLLNDRIYIFLTFQYTNTTDAEVEFVRGTCGVYRLDENLIVQDYSVDVAYIDQYWLGGTAAEANHYRLKPGESITSEVGYIVHRDFVKDSSQVYFALRQSDCMAEFGGATDPEAIFVKLEYAQ